MVVNDYNLFIDGTKAGNYTFIRKIEYKGYLSIFIVLCYPNCIFWVAMVVWKVAEVRSQRVKIVIL